MNTVNEIATGASDEAPTKRRGGRPKGKWHGKVWREAVMRAANRRDPTTGRKYLEIAADALVREAIMGEPAALKELGDRLDGRVTGAGDGEGQVRVSFVVRLPAEVSAGDWARSVPATVVSQPQLSEARWHETTHAAAECAGEEVNGNELGSTPVNVVALPRRVQTGDETGDSDG